jgi:ABC-type transport system involved in multi-copper enzyme maturation permease subunit
MIWLSWRQFRTQAVIGFAAVAAIFAVFAATRPALQALARDTGFAACTTDCNSVAESFLRQAQAGRLAPLYYAGLIVLYATPALLGLFWGAPMVARELEGGTYRLVWNQTVSRTRWLAVKLGLAGLATAVAAGLISLTVTWWASPLDRAGRWITPDVFAARGLVPVGYAVFAFVVGVTVGVVLRRAIPAMLVTFVIVVAAQVASPFLLRPYLAGHDTYSAALTADQVRSIGLSPDDTDRRIRVEAEADVTGEWSLDKALLTAAGKPFEGPYDPATCGMKATGGPDQCRNWIAAQNLTVLEKYIGPDKFWVLQWRELGVFLVVSAALAIFCFWWIRRRVA